MYILRLPAWKLFEVRGLFEKEDTEAWGGAFEEGRGEVRATMWVAV